MTFSKQVTGVDPTDFAIARTGTVGTTLSQVTPVAGSGGTQYTVTASGITGADTLGLNLVDDGSIRDPIGNPLIKAIAGAAFQSQATFSVGNNPNSEVLADVNQDGIADLVTANSGSTNVSVLLGLAVKRGRRPGADNARRKH